LVQMTIRELAHLLENKLVKYNYFLLQILKYINYYLSQYYIVALTTVKHKLCTHLMIRIYFLFFS
jgi:hypothetical protein